MMKRVMGVMVLVGAMGLVGCNRTERVGSVHGVNFTVVRSSAFEGPNVAALVADTGTQESVRIVGTFASDGVLNSAVQATGDVVAADVYRGDNIQSSTTVNVRGPVRPPLTGNP